MIAARRSPGGVFYRSPGGVRGRVAVEVIRGAFNYWVLALALRADNSIYCGGAFTQYAGVSKSRAALLRRTGSLNTAFDAPITSGLTVRTVRDIAVQGDGKIIYAGALNKHGTDFSRGIARLNADGSLDSTFDASDGFTITGSFLASVASVGIQDDGKIVCGGSFDKYGAVDRNMIARLNDDGSLDGGFTVGDGFLGSVGSVGIQDDGKIVCGGSFLEYDGDSLELIARLDDDGSLDGGFDTASGFTGTGAGVTTVAIQEDQKVICGGRFSAYKGTARQHIARLDTDASLDASFDSATGFSATAAIPLVHCVDIQADGKIVCGGSFGAYKGVARRNIARLNADGSLDAGFDPGDGCNDQVFGIKVQPDGKVLCCGYFTEVDGVSRPYIARLNTDGTLDTSFYQQ